MKTTKAGMLKTLATRTVIAVIPVAMVSTYASGIFVQPPRLAQFDYTPVAEIVDSSTTIGMAESPLYGMSQADINAQLDQLQSIGVQNIRVFVPWGLIEQQDNNYDWSLLDRVMAAAAARNMGVMAEVNATPTWAGPNPGNPGFPPGSDTPNTAAFTNFMQAFMAHQVAVPGAILPVSYASIVSAYEIWNEPNSMQFSNPISPEAYATLLAAVYPIIKAVDPTSTVVAGAVGATQNTLFTMNPVDFVKRMLTALGPNALNYFDALSVHPYGVDTYSAPCPTCAPNILTPKEQVEAIMALIGGKQVWLSEYGVASTNAAGYQQQATWIKDLLDTWQNYSQAGPVFLYTGQDYNGTDGGQDMGIWTEVGGEKVYVDSNGVTHTVSEMIKDWIAEHPQPTNPTNPGIPVLNPVLALVQSLVAGVQAFVTAVVTAITNFLGGLASSLSGVGASVAPLSLRSASVESFDTASLAAESDVAAGTEEAKAGDTKDAEAAAEATATEKTAAAEVPAEVTKTPVEPVVSTEPTVPAATVPPATETTTETTTETVGTTTEPTTETPGAKPGTTTGTSSSSTTSTGSSTDSSGSPSGESGAAGKPGDSDGQSKPDKVKDKDHDKSDKSDKDKSDKSDKDGHGRHARGNGGASHEAAKAEAPKADAPKHEAPKTKAESTSESSGGSAS